MSGGAICFSVASRQVPHSRVFLPEVRELIRDAYGLNEHDAEHKHERTSQNDTSTRTVWPKSAI